MKDMKNLKKKGAISQKLSEDSKNESGHFEKFRRQIALKTTSLEMFSLLHFSTIILVSKMGFHMNLSLLVRSECTEM